MAKAEEMITLTREQFAELLAAVRPAPAPKPPDDEEQFARLQKMASERPFAPDIPWGRVLSPTGATFIPRVIPSKTHPKGRVVDLLEYTHPEGVDRHQSDGGLVPDGHPILVTNKAGQMLSADYKQWKYTTFWRQDLNTYVGKDAGLLPPVIAPSSTSQAAE